MTQPIQVQPNHLAGAERPYRAAVEEFYRTKRGSLPAFDEAWHYFKEEVGEAEEEVEEREEWSWEPKPVDFVNRERLAKELADVMFTLYGVAIAANIDLDEAFRLVVESNMTKERTTEGKVRKGEAYRAPNMETALL